MSTTTHPTLTFDELVRLAVEDWGAVVNMAHTKNLTNAEANKIAAAAIAAAAGDWCVETGQSVPMSMQTIALARITYVGWDEWERQQQLELALDEPIFRGAAAAEARRDLG